MIFRSLQNWPRPFTTERKSSPFRSTYQQTIDLLETEIDHLNARNAVLQLALRPDDIRLDGLPRANAQTVAHPGVILTFEKFVPNGKRSENGLRLGKYVPFSMPCDAFTDWESNLRAIAIALEALRKIDRYGVTQSGEQYIGWAALPQGDDEATRAARFIVDEMRAGAAADGVVVTVEGLLSDAALLQRAYRLLARRLHPDTPETGSHDKFVQLKAAYDLLSKKVPS